MAEEQLNLIDRMSPSLRRIFQEAQKLNKKMQELKSGINKLHFLPNKHFADKMELSRRKTEQLRKEIERTKREADKLNSIHNIYRYGAGNRLTGLRALYTTSGKFIRPDERYSFYRSVIDRYTPTYVQKHPIRHFQNLLKKSSSYTDSPFHKLENPITSVSDKLLRFGAALVSVWYALSRVKQIVQDVMIKPQNQYISNLTRVALTSDKQKTPNEMIESLYETASRTRAPIEGTLMLYNRIAMSGVKASNERIRRFVESFNKVTAISGTTGQENRAVMLQLAQGIGSNRLGGDEFRSISEQAPLFKYMLAKGLGVNPGALKQMGAEGKLTAEAIISALEKVQDQIDEIFKDAPLTIDQTVTILQNEWSNLIRKQMAGYVAIRDLIRDVTIWMRSAEGQETISRMIRGWNKLIYSLTSFIRAHGKQILNAFISFVEWLTPVVLWLLNHGKQLIWTFIAIKTAIFGIRTAMMVCNFVEWFNGGSKSALLFISALTKVNGLLLTTMGILMWGIAAIMLAWQVGLKIADWDQKRRTKNALTKVNDDILNKHMRDWKIKQGIEINQPMTREQHKAYDEEKNRVIKILKDSGQRDYDTYTKNTDDFKMFEEKANNQEELLKNITGMIDSSKNVPMVGKVKEVGRVNDDISIDNDGIEMMKAIAERQWVMQNEVNVPQNVNISVTKEADIDEEKLAEAITGGMKLAVASSMRGAPA